MSSLSRHKDKHRGEDSIVDVVRKPEGMSANLRANQDLMSDKDAVGSLAQRGFYPIPSGPNGEIEILEGLFGDFVCCGI